MVGQSGASLVAIFLDQAKKPANGLTANVFAGFVLLFSASSVFSELQDDLNKMWDARPPGSGMRGLFLQKLFSFVLVLASGVLVLASMLATASVSIVAHYFRDLVPVPPLLLEAANLIITFAVLSLVFVLVYRFVPDCRLPWPELWFGAVLSALLFVIGKAALGYYLSRTGVGSAYGAAGSIIAFALWLYYSAQIFLFAAEFTYVWGKGPALAAAD
jgi:membrane protein